MPHFFIERVGSCQPCGFCSARTTGIPLRLQNMNCTLKFYFKAGSETSHPLDPDIEIVSFELSGAPLNVGQLKKIENITEWRVDIVGSCLACGSCCGFGKPAENRCSHLDGVGLCTIYANLDDWCEEHGGTHSFCKGEPNQPVHFGNPACGYSFIINAPGTPLDGREVLRFGIRNFNGHALEGGKIRQ